jgi:hypothetical protein
MYLVIPNLFRNLLQTDAESYFDKLNTGVQHELLFNYFFNGLV